MALISDQLLDMDLSSDQLFDMVLIGDQLIIMEFSRDQLSNMAVCINWIYGKSNGSYKVSSSNHRNDVAFR